MEEKRKEGKRTKDKKESRTIQRMKVKKTKKEEYEMNE